jgi:hypothetical protein
MIKIIIIGLWVCVVTIASSYAAAYFSSGKSSASKQDPYLEGMEYRRTQTVTIPMIEGGTIRGYVMARFVFTADARTLRELPIDPTPFVTSEAFNEVYVNGQVRFNQLQKYNFKQMTETIRTNVNTRLNGDIIKDVLIDGVNYIDKNDIRLPSNRSPSAAQPTQ